MDITRYKLTVNDAHEFDLTMEALQTINAVENTPGEFHILSGQQSFRAKIVEADLADKKISILVNGNRYDVSIKDHFDQLVDKMGLSTYAVHKVKDIKAPMPGLVLDIAVTAGQEVKVGDKLLILEAMKMENVIKSEGEGTIKSIHVEKGAAVDKGQLMIEMD